MIRRWGIPGVREDGETIGRRTREKRGHLTEEPRDKVAEMGLRKQKGKGAGTPCSGSRGGDARCRRPGVCVGGASWSRE